MGDSEKDRKRSNLWMTPFLLITVFFLSFSTSAYIYINSRNLVFASDAGEVKRLTKIIGKKDAEITELTKQVDRYKALYQAALDTISASEIEAAEKKEYEASDTSPDNKNTEE